MDSLDSYYHFKNGSVCLSCLEDETKISKEPYDSYTDVGFVGKIYRYLVYTLNMPSKDVIRLISPRELDSLAMEYELYNTNDAVKSIISRYHWKRNQVKKLQSEQMVTDKDWNMNM